MVNNNRIEITHPTDLLDKKGHLQCPGYCKRNYYIYNKEAIKNHLWRIKEWDYYMISNGRYMTELNFYNISIWAALTAEVIDLKTGKRYSDITIEPSYPNKYKMSPGADRPFCFTYKKFGRNARFITDDHSHELFYSGKSGKKYFKISITGQRLENQESLTCAIPFKKDYCFFYTQKLNCIQASGTVSVGDLTIEYNPVNSYVVMDWGRGIWPWRNNWYWSNGSSMINGKLFGFEMTWGFGDETAAAQTALFYDGKCHKIDSVRLENDPEKKGWMKPWHFKSKDGRLDLIMTPNFHRNNGIIFLNLIGMKSHQIFGLFNGYVILDDHAKLIIKDMPAFAEKVRNCW